MDTFHDDGIGLPEEQYWIRSKLFQPLQSCIVHVAVVSLSGVVEHTSLDRISVVSINWNKQCSSDLITN